MKKLLCLLLTVFTIGAYAQRSGDFLVGVHTHYGMSGIGSKSDSLTSDVKGYSRASFLFGVDAEYVLNEKVSLYGEFNYLSYGFTQNTVVPFFGNFEVKYTEVAYEFQVGAGIYPFKDMPIYVRPKLGYRLATSQDVQSSIVSSNGKFDPIKSQMLGAITIGYKLQLTKALNLDFGLDHSHTLMTFGSEYDIDSDGGTIANYITSLHLGVQYKLN